MPKMKTHSGAKKRFRFTGSGKLMKQQINMRHNLEHPSSKPGPGSVPSRFQEAKETARPLADA